MPAMLFLIGLHGCGKSTLGQRIQEVEGWRSFSVGDLGRSARSNMPVDGVSIRTLVRLGKVSPGHPMDLDVASMLVNDLSRHPFVVCDGFPASPEHLQLIPAGSTLVLVKCNENLREARLTQRAIDTCRSWTPGMPSERDCLVANVFEAAKGFNLSVVTYDNSGPLDSGAVILSRLGSHLLILHTFRTSTH